jgi:hypothetical protein
MDIRTRDDSRNRDAEEPVGLMTAKKEKWKDRSRIVHTNASFHAFRPDSAIRGEKKALQ